MSDEHGSTAQEHSARRELFAVLAHELRSPIGAVLGFEELLSDGRFGEIGAGGRDALARIRGSAERLLDLVAGLEDLAGGDGEATWLEPDTVTAAQLVGPVLQELEQEATGREIRMRLEAPANLPAIITDPERARLALRLALMAGIKNAAGREILLRAHADSAGLSLQLHGTTLRAPDDDPDLPATRPGPAGLTGAGLRIVMARRVLAPLRGRLALEAGDEHAVLQLQLPSLARD